MAFIKTKLSTIRPNDLYDTLRLTYGFNNEEDQKQPGILAKPAEPVSDSDVVAAGFFDYMLTKSRERAAKLRAEAMEQYARDSAEEAAKIRSILGITRSKAPTEQLSDTARDAMFSSSDMRGTELTMKDNAREAQEVFQPMITPVSRGEQPEMTDSPAPVDAPSVDARSNEMLDKPKGIMSKDIEDVLKTVLDSDVSDSTDSADGGAAPSDGKEIETGEAGEATKTITDLVYDDFVGDKQEGDEAHVGQDIKNITLAGGVVPDGLKYDGKDFTQGAAKVVGFDKTKLDTSGAHKKVGNVTVKRSDFDSDKAFAKGVIEEFKNQAKTAAGNSWDKMSEGSKKAVVKIGWNKGTGWYTGESAKVIYKELAKEEPDATNLYSKILTGSTVEKGGASIGIAKARANAWNETISATGGKEIVKIEANNSETNTAFKYYDKDGNLLHTEQTDRASTKYENKGRDSISKNAAGEW